MFDILPRNGTALSTGGCAHQFDVCETVFLNFVNVSSKVFFGRPDDDIVISKACLIFICFIRLKSILLACY